MNEGVKLPKPHTGFGILRCMGTPSCFFSSFFNKGKQLMWLPVYFPGWQDPSKTEINLKAKNLLPMDQAYVMLVLWSFLLVLLGNFATCCFKPNLAGVFMMPSHPTLAAVCMVISVTLGCCFAHYFMFDHLCCWFFTIFACCFFVLSTGVL